MLRERGVHCIYKPQTWTITDIHFCLYECLWSARFPQTLPNCNETWCIWPVDVPDTFKYGSVYSLLLLASKRYTFCEVSLAFCAATYFHNCRKMALKPGKNDDAKCRCSRTIRDTQFTVSGDTWPRTYTRTDCYTSLWCELIPQVYENCIGTW